MNCSDPMCSTIVLFHMHYKCSLFGCSEIISRQVNFFCDEAGNCGKGTSWLASYTLLLWEPRPRLVSWISPLLRRGLSTLEVISQWNVPDQWNVINSWPYAPAYLLIVQSVKRRHLSLSLKKVLQSITCMSFACGANSVPKDPCLHGLLMLRSSVYVWSVYHA